MIEPNNKNNMEEGDIADFHFSKDNSQNHNLPYQQLFISPTQLKTKGKKCRELDEGWFTPGKKGVDKRRETSTACEEIKQLKDNGEISEEEELDSSSVILAPPVLPSPTDVRISEHIFYESRLKKYHPGFHSDGFQVLLQATSKYLEYYKQECRCWLNKPLIKFEYKFISKIQRVRFGYFSGYQFEIILKEGWNKGLLDKKIKKIQKVPIP